ncbi:hypothetical protein ES319_D07G227300v1 [Gossypium barbadense]|uniref:CDC45-like protein n=2 Tax=Gossypium TaxID=3633 RepID=A0A5J5QUK5_GOSBA|nr:hypothetical protein ES319_D07G227300v1 [Gossypium barbadense]TYG62596.1 hypothetical protein ES288_D07G244300v1 [Gossypium darwinii]
MVREERVESFCARLRASSLSPLLIFPSTSDVDSLCALKIIFHILESDSVRYSCYPVSSFQEIREYAASELSSSSEEPLGSAARVFVVDSHRPIHLHNLSDQNDQVVVLCTKDDERLADLAYDFEVMELANASYCLHNSELDGEEDEDSESEDDDEDEEVEGRARDGSRKRRRLSSEGEEEPPARRLKKLKREYYQMGTFHGKPSGCLMYDLSHCLRKNTNELLWLACVSLTDQFVHERLTDERYEAGVMELQQHINSLGNLDAVTSVTLKDGTKVRAPDSSRIAYEEEPRLMLLREWNLFDSMLCSSYIAPKLKTWSDNGLKKLKLLLARMGFALVDCQQKFEYMNHEVTQKMKNQFEQILPEYGLNDFYYKSFLRLHGYTSRVSAADMVYGVTALLESFVQSDGSCAVKQFRVAYDALSLSNLDKLKSGMQQAIKIQRAILRQGSAAIINNSVDTKLLGHPKARTKFCYFLMDALKEKGAELNPLLCACMLQEPSKVLIVGVCGKPLLGALQGNAFGLAFRKAAEETGAQFFHELFETSWIVLDAGVVNSFMIKLTERL